MVTADQFRKLFPNNKEPEAWAAALSATLPAYGIDTPARIAPFLAQTGHESEGFTATRENLNYSAEALARTWPRRFPSDVAARYARQPEKIANRAYADRMGNGPEASGDGWKFRGRGPLQATGKDNYAAFARHKGMTLDEVVACLETKEGGIEFACWFWVNNGLNELADAGKFVTITKRINGGVNGLDDRQSRLAQAQVVFAA